MPVKVMCYFVFSSKLFNHFCSWRTSMSYRGYSQLCNRLWPNPTCWLQKGSDIGFHSLKDCSFTDCFNLWLATKVTYRTQGVHFVPRVHGFGNSWKWWVWRCMNSCRTQYFRKDSVFLKCYHLFNHLYISFWFLLFTLKKQWQYKIILINMLCTTTFIICDLEYD